MRYLFGPFSLDTQTHELRRGAEVIHLQPKSYGLLLLLLERRPEVLSKQAIHDALWSGLHVSDASLARVASELRTALGETAREPVWVRTVHGYGYGLDGEVRVEGEEPLEEAAESASALALPSRHVLITPRSRVFLHGGENLLGRDPDCEVFVDSAQVSRRHCKILVDGEHATLEDLGSKNGTWVGGERIEQPVLLSPGDVIEIGPVALVYGEPLDESTLTRTEP